MYRLRLKDFLLCSAALATGLVTAILAANTGQAQTNDDFENAEVLTGQWATANSDNSSATAQPGEPSHAGLPAGSSLWWQWTAPFDGEVAVDTLGSGPGTFGPLLDTVLAVYTGTNLTGLTQVAANDDLYPIIPFILSGQNSYPLPYFGPSGVRFNAKAGTTYYIAVDGYPTGLGSDVGPIVLNLALHPSGVFRFATEDFDV